MAKKTTDDQSHVTKTELDLILQLIRQEIANLKEDIAKNHETYMQKVQFFGGELSKLRGEQQAMIAQLSEGVHTNETEIAVLRDRLSIFAVVTNGIALIAASIAAFLGMKK